MSVSEKSVKAKRQQRTHIHNEKKIDIVECLYPTESRVHFFVLMLLMFPLYSESLILINFLMLCVHFRFIVKPIYVYTFTSHASNL